MYRPCFVSVEISSIPLKCVECVQISGFYSIVLHVSCAYLVAKKLVLTSSALAELLMTLTMGQV